MQNHRKSNLQRISSELLVEVVIRQDPLFCRPVGLQLTDLVPWGRRGPIAALDAGRSLSSGRALRGPVGRYDRNGRYEDRTSYQSRSKVIANRAALSPTPRRSPPAFAGNLQALTFLSKHNVAKSIIWHENVA